MPDKVTQVSLLVQQDAAMAKHGERLEALLEKLYRQADYASHAGEHDSANTSLAMCSNVIGQILATEIGRIAAMQEAVSPRSRHERRSDPDLGDVEDDDPLEGLIGGEGDGDG